MPSRKEAPTPKKTRRPAVARRAAQPVEATVAASSAPAPAPTKAQKKAAPAAAEVFGRTSGKTPSKAAVAKAAKPVKATEPPKAVKAVKPPKPAKPAKPPKSTKPAKPAMAPAAESPAAEPKPPKHKLVRDSFTIPRGEYQQLDALKQRLVTLLRPTKKSELLRAGIKLLSSLPDDALLVAVNDVPAIKTGRPVKS